MLIKIPVKILMFLLSPVYFKRKLGRIYKTKATNVYKRSSPWKKAYVAPVKKDKSGYVLARFTGIDDDALEKSYSKSKKIETGEFLVLDEKYKTFKKRTAVSNRPITKHPKTGKNIKLTEKDKEGKNIYKDTGEKLSSKDFKNIRKHIKK